MPELTITIGMATSSGATHSAAGDPIFGRERELTELEELVDGVFERGAALLVRGEPGIGKSTLVAASRRAEEAGMLVLRTTGVQSEAQLPFRGCTSSFCRYWTTPTGYPSHSGRRAYRGAHSKP
jgi:hypothetical protein